MPVPSSPIFRAFNRWANTFLLALDNKLDIGSPIPSADKLTTAFGVVLTGDATASSSTDGSTTLTLPIELANTGIAAGTYAVLTVDAKGRATSGRALLAADIPSLDAEKVTSGVFAALRIPTLNQNTTGSAATLTTSRNISMTGDGTWSVPFNGGANATAAFTLASSGVTAGTYPKVTVDAKGRVTAGAVLAAGDIPNLDTSKMTSGTLSISRGGTGGTTQATARTALGIGSMATRDVTISTAAPSGGVDGQIWLQY
jgi:phage-related tail fiber protein